MIIHKDYETKTLSLIVQLSELERSVAVGLWLGVWDLGAG